MRGSHFCRSLLALLVLNATANAAEHLRLAKEFYQTGWSSSECQLQPFLPGADLGVAVFRGSPGGLTLRSDGTAAGTYVLSEASFARDGDGPVSEVAVLGSRAYWAARTPDGGLVLRESDGTVGGTGVTMVLDEPSSTETVPHLAALAGRLLILGKYLGKDGVWLSDATPGGTHLLAVAAGFGPPLVTETRVFFTVVNPGHGYQSWVTDGTSAGTHPVNGLCEGTCPEVGNNMVVAGGLAFFLGDAGVQSGALWRSDGSPEGTLRLLDAFPNGTVGSPYSVRPVGTRLTFFLSGPGDSSHLWASDGTREGTIKLFDFPTAGNDWPYYNGGFFGGVAANTGSALFFIADDGVHGTELWITDGTQDGTHLVRDINPGASGVDLSFLGVSRGVALMRLDDGVHGAELWRSDGTAAGTFMVADICPGKCSSNPSQVAIIGNTALFSATSFPAGGEIDREVWKADLVTNRAELLADICQGMCSSVNSSWLALTVGAKFAVFGAMSTDGYCRLWSSDGTAGGTAPLFEAALRYPYARGGGFKLLMNVNGRLLFATGSDPWFDTWVSDPATGSIIPASVELSPTSWTVSGDRLFGVSNWQAGGGQSLVAIDMNGGAARTLASCYPACRVGFQPFHGGVLYAASDGEHGAELWASDGSANGTRLVRDIVPGAGGSDPRGFARTRGAIFFSVDAGSQSRDLWKSDATAAGTQLVSPGLDPGGFVSAGDRVYFVSYRLVGGTLRVSDGTAAGTLSLPGKEPSEMTPFHGGLLFVGRSLLGYELWHTDGTSDGTAMVKDILPGANSSHPSSLTAAGRHAFFAAAAQTGNTELWVTDGTAAGTAMVKEISPGLMASNPTSMVAVFDKVYFVASDRDHGAEIWRSDGTPEGTAMVEDLCPGACSSTPEALTRVGSTIYFTADDWVHGNSLWALDLDLVEASVVDTAVGADEPSADVEVELSGVPAQDITLGYETEDGTARAGIDYTPASGTLAIAAGTRTAPPITVGVTVRHQGDPEKWFLVHLTERSGGTVRRSTAQVTLSDHAVWRNFRRHLQGGSRR